ncbi:hypothetical protein [Lentibacter sp.]|uniref:hypothetical protein n=1 Tax=Lentibacter sp. TaxID=2024994 RepID=UPI003F6963E7
MRALFVFILTLSLAACAEFPELDAKMSAEMKAAGYPSLAPTSELEALTTPPQATDTTAAALTARAAALRARAARLSGSVVSRADKARLRSDLRLPKS